MEEQKVEDNNFSPPSTPPQIQFLARISSTTSLNSSVSENYSLWTPQKFEEEILKLEIEKKKLETERKQFELERTQYLRALLQFHKTQQQDFVEINVGGEIFQTTKSTLCVLPTSILGLMMNEKAPIPRFFF